MKIQFVLKLLANYYHDLPLVAINGMYSAVWKSARHGNAGKGQLVFHVDVVTCLKGSDDNDEHNHLVISDLVSILRFEKSG